MLGTMLSQRRRARPSLQHKVYLGKERLQLLCCGCPLSALLLRLATVVDHSGRTSIEHTYVVCIMKRHLSGVARRLWSKCLLSGADDERGLRVLLDNPEIVYLDEEPPDPRDYFVPFFPEN